ncbi:hypothetical protein THIAE_07855 [Thiomicrospira aerophila AL3]|uniref:FlgN family protein n=1 Tax=Thiomicrospira aerophila AL3 TaxID=717772 RepID=W0DV73_9GAMM|nr:flagellar export chaperone FlgN [Thiomicrospira aerophila]AHF02342.1 hypothetical protein THIAE_07855 [Thiomicrospira aerophila AL3]
MSLGQLNHFNNWALITELNAQLLAFIQLLEKEKTSLTLQKVDDILSCVDEKTIITTRLNELIAQLNPHSLADITASAANDPSTQSLASEFKTLSVQAQTQNESNQTLLATLYKINGQLLNSIEHSLQPSFKGYSPSGQPSKQSRHRSLGEA